jgi:hypothetical protein
MIGIVNSFLVMSVDFDALVNGTRLKRLVMSLENKSDYYLDIPIGTYFSISDHITKKYTFPYLQLIDSKKDNEIPFRKLKIMDKKVNKKVKEKVIKKVKV